MHDSLITKKVIAHSLKELMETIPFQKISIRDIMNHCDIRRQTFYYHFQDKYELLAWIYNQEASENIEDYLDYEHWTKVITRLFEYLAENKTFYNNALAITEQNSFDRYFFDHTQNLLLKIITDMMTQQNIELPEETLAFFNAFYSHAFVGTAKDWLMHGCTIPPLELSENIQLIVEDSFLSTLKRYSEQKNK